jgi:para-aminobenzoate synthetase component I
MPENLQQLFPIHQKSQFVQKAMAWSSKFTYVAYFDPNDFEYPFQPFKHMIGVASAHTFTLESANDSDTFFARLKSEHKRKWLMGFLGYDLKNQTEQLHSNNKSLIAFPNALLFEPEIRLEWLDNMLKIEAPDPQQVFKDILETEPENRTSLEGSQVLAHESKSTYITHVEQIIDWIAAGEVYEMNYCLGYSLNNINYTPVQLFSSLNKKSPTPFAGFLQAREFGIVSASPERFLKRSGDSLISQPIKGTAPRNLLDLQADEQLAIALRNSEKEQAENLMIVDLVRNDLSRSCEPGSVQVHELFGIYSFSQVHQMISTVLGTKRKEVHFSDAISMAFPMGSMTGAPKIRAMQLIEELENFRRGPFSGAFGYIDPDGQFDFNVLIRSVFLNQHTSENMFAAGSAITYDAIPELEWHECALKWKAIREILAEETEEPGN